jgi:hypothetical protein
MLTFTYTHDHSQQLTLIEETPIALVFRKGKKSEQTKPQQWIHLGLTVFCLVVFAENFLKGAIVLQSVFLFSPYVWMTAISIAVAILIYFNPYWVTWTLDRDSCQFIRTTHRCLLGKSKRSFSFDQIREVKVDQYESADSEGVVCAYLCIVLTSGKEIKLSQSKFSYDKREKAIALKYHREIAEKMRHYLGLSTPPQERAEDVYVPSIAEIQQEKAAAWAMLKDLFSAVFSKPEMKQAKINELRQQIAQDPHEAKKWEQLGLFLVQQKATLQEGFNAYRRAEQLYRDCGEIEKADEIKTLLRRYGG